MSWLAAASAVQRPSRRGWNRPGLEPLEDRRLLAVTYHGGPVIRNIEVEPVFYGPYWNSAAGQQQASDLDAFLSFLITSSYMDMLGEYGAGHGVLADRGITVGTASSRVDDSTLQQTLTGGIAGGLLPPPDGNRLYLVFTGPNVDVTLGNQDSAHDFYGYHDFFTGPTGASVYYVVIAHPIGNGTFYNLNVFQTLTKTVSHELAEAVTDPGVGGWYDGRTGKEVGDLAEGPQNIGILGPYVVQGVWSAQMQTIVLPVGAQRLDARSVSAKPLTTSLNQVANAFTHSDEYFSHLVTLDYADLLHRTPSLAEVSSWVGLLKNGLTDEQLLAGFVSSPEYYAQSGNTDQGWLDALYHDVLGRNPDAAGEAAWLKTVAAGTNRFSVAYAFAASVEHENIVVLGDYQRYLGRTATAPEVTGWVNNLQHGWSNEQVVAGFVASDEFYASHGSSISGWLTAAYQLVFQRPPDVSGYDYWNAYLQNAQVGG